MFLPKLHRRLSLGLFGLLFGVMLLFTGCASTSVKEDVDAVLEEPPNEMAAEAVIPDEEVIERVIVESVSVAGAGDRVLISTSGAVRYTVFRLSDPPRLIVDLPDIELDSIEPHTTVDNYYIKDISAITYGGDERIGRVIIALKDGIDHDVQSSESSILVMLREEPEDGVEVQESGWPYVKALQEEDKVVADLSELLGTDEEAAEEAEAEEVVVEEAAAEPAAPASAITSVEVSSGADRAIVNIGADGTIGRYNAFEIESPARIVVDVWGLDNLSGTQRVNGDDNFVKRVRIGRHPEKVRLVFDTYGTEIPPYMIEKEGQNLLLTFGEVDNGEELMAEEPADVPVEEVAVVEEAEAARGLEVAMVEEPAVELVEEPVAVVVEEVAAVVMEPVAEETEEIVEEVAAVVVEEASEPVPVVILPMVNLVDFKKIGLGSGAKGRVIVKSTEAVELKVKASKDKMTVVFDVENAEIAEEFVRTLDASRLGTPVASVSSYLENDEPSQVRVLVRLQQKATYNIEQTGNRIAVDFEPIPVPMAAAKTAVAEETVAEDEEASTEETGADEAKYSGVKIDLDMMEANITDVLRLLAEVSDLNIIASDDVKGSISLRLKNVPWDQAFDIILRSKGLDMIQEGNVVRVAPAAKINKEREESLAAFKAQEQLEPLVLEFVPISYATTDGLITQVKSVLSKRGTVSSESRTNTLIIKDIPSGIEAARELIAKLDTPIPQVLIEARIVEASTSFARDLGIQWGIDYQTGTESMADVFGATTTSGQTPPANTVNPAFVT
ncbi:MAG: AMIN domain-containing protein, partial [Proteobacteria bacterium]|nr:AMIN domain-containing protein [Pseudomonadota bacterium]